jgi:hypothetical protein
VNKTIDFLLDFEGDERDNGEERGEGREREKRKEKGEGEEREGERRR